MAKKKLAKTTQKSRGKRSARNEAAAKPSLKHPRRQPRYAVALSFAGTDRKLAESVARILRKNNVSVFYDRFEEHELWGRNLHETFQEVYSRQCRYCVMFLSPNYLSRMWPVFERQQIIDRLATEHGQESVLPIRIDGFSDEVPGLSNGVGYLSVSSYEHQRIADALLRKVGRVGYELDSTEAYLRAKRDLKERARGVLKFDHILTSLEAAKNSFSEIISGELLQFLGHEFFWKREEGDNLILFAKNDESKKRKTEGLVSICQFEAPEAWVGCGRWALHWPTSERKKNKDYSDGSEILLLLYLYSDDPEHLEQLASDEAAMAVFLGALYLSERNAEEFYSLAEEKYESLR